MGVPSNFVTPTGWMASAQGNFVPDIFSKKLQLKFYSQTILDQISNTDYEGEISGQGSKVIIRTVPSVSVSDYAGTVSYADVTTSTLELIIDKAKSFAFKVDDVLKSMSDVSFWDEASKDASNQMRISVETDFLANIVTGVASGNTVAPASAPTSATILDSILDAARLLDEANIPDDDRFIVLPPKHIQMLKQSDLKAVYLTGDSQSPLRNGKVGNVDRFTIYQSNLLATGTGGDAGKKLCLAGHRKYATFASKFTNVETVRLESTFGDGVRGLKVYGYKVIQPTAGVVLKLA